MDKINDNNIESTLDYAEKGKKGFKQDNPGRPEGSTNKYTITKLIEAIEEEEKTAINEGDVGLFRKFARMAYGNPTVMIAIMKKFVPDKQYTETKELKPEGADSSGLTVEEIKAYIYDYKIKKQTRNKAESKKMVTKDIKN